LSEFVVLGGMTGDGDAAAECAIDGVRAEVLDLHGEIIRFDEVRKKGEDWGLGRERGVGREAMLCAVGEKNDSGEAVHDCGRGRATADDVQAMLRGAALLESEGFNLLHIAVGARESSRGQDGRWHKSGAPARSPDSLVSKSHSLRIALRRCY